MANVEVIASDDIETYTTYSDANGDYYLEVPEGPTYTIALHKDFFVDNGVSTFDIVISARHILEIELFADSLQAVAADANNNNSVSSIDLVRMRQVILGINDEFPESESWRFLPTGIMVQSDETIDFTGVKIGDPSGNANPN